MDHMDHHDWDLPDGDGDADTADLAGDDGGDLPDVFGLGGHDLGDDLGHELGDDGGHELGHLGGPDALDEPLGTEHAAAHFDAAIADADGDDGAGYDGGAEPDVVGPELADLVPDVDHGYAEAMFGHEPQFDVDADWLDHAFPPELSIVDPPEPVDGFPWSDPGTLGDGEPHDYLGDGSLHGAPEASELAGYEGYDLPRGSDVWTVLFGVDDPATSSLARWWAPGG
jgi:hypothetical protein